MTASSISAKLKKAGCTKAVRVKSRQIKWADWQTGYLVSMEDAAQSLVKIEHKLPNYIRGNERERRVDEALQRYQEKLAQSGVYAHLVVQSSWNKFLRVQTKLSE